MKKIFALAVAALVVFAPAANANKKHNNNNYCVDCNQYNYNNRHHHNNNNFYNDPNFWWGAGAGLLGGAIVNGIAQPRYQPYCYWVDAQVFDPNIGVYVFRPVQVCN